MSLYFAGVWCIEEHNTSIAPQRMRDRLINIILAFDPDLKAFKQWLKDVGIQTNKDATERLKMIRNVDSSKNFGKEYGENAIPRSHK
jgi:hypothetical protein